MHLRRPRDEHETDTRRKNGINATRGAGPASGPAPRGAMALRNYFIG